MSTKSSNFGSSQFTAQKKAFLDVSVSICPYCGSPYADASWYATELAADVECGTCGKIWNPNQSKVDRILLEFTLDEDKKVIAVKKRGINEER